MVDVAAHSRSFRYALMLPWILPESEDMQSGGRKKRTLNQSSPFFPGEVAGYLTRYLSIVDSTNSNLWLGSMLLIILSPNFLAATDYILMARL